MKKIVLILGVLSFIFIQAFATNTYDVQPYNIGVPQGFRAGTVITVSGTLENMGSATVTSVVVTYTIDGGTPVSQTFSGLSCTTSNTFPFSFTKTWTSTAGNHTVNVKIPTVNGQPNQNQYTGGGMNASVLAWTPGNQVLVELFSSASCHYCAQYDPTLYATCSKDADVVIGLNYETSSPGPDPMFNSDNGPDINTRFNFYGLTGVPQDCVDGTHETNGGLLANGSDYNVGVSTGKSPVMQIINPSFKLSNNTITCSATAEAVQAVSGNISAFIAVTEDNVTSASARGSNGQTSWSWVLKKMIPSGSGTALPSSMSAGATKNFSGSWTLANIYDITQIRVVFFIQNMSTKEVYWTTKVSKALDIEENNNLSFESIYPNPAYDYTNVFFNLIKPEKISLRVYDILGKNIITKDLGLMPDGKSHFTLNLDNLITGIYLVELSSASGTSFKKISVVR